MSKWILAAGAAALALVTPALAGPGHGGGGGGPKGGGGEHGGPKGGGGGQPQAHGGGHGGGNADIKVQSGKGGGPQMHVQRSHGGGQMRVAHGNGSGHKAAHQMARAEHDQSGGKHAERQAARFNHDNQKVAKAERRNVERAIGNRDAQLLHNRDHGDFRVAKADSRFASYDGLRNLGAFSDGCPPGLAKKNNGCLPPGQAKRMIGSLLPAALGSQLLNGPYSQWYRDNDQYYYRNDGDYIYRVNRQDGLINALFPYQDQAYSYYPVGMNYPADYNYYNVPYQYQSYYPDGSDYNYRYGDGAIYQVNRSNSAINSIVALLAGDLGVGQQLPNDYGVYNVPMAYRDRYYDTPDALYRYNDGYIYRADPKTQLITAVIDALV